jgi:YD repeat-containing protein
MRYRCVSESVARTFTTGERYDQQKLKKGDFEMWMRRGVSESRLGEQPAASHNRMTRKRALRAAGLMTSVALLTLSATTFAASNVNYTYDALGRLTKIAYGDGVKTTTVSYSYDAAGNRTSVVTSAPS